MAMPILMTTQPQSVLSKRVAAFHCAEPLVISTADIAAVITPPGSIIFYLFFEPFNIQGI
jgi:hypothetical protein